MLLPELNVKIEVSAASNQRFSPESCVGKNVPIAENTPSYSPKRRQERMPSERREKEPHAFENVYLVFTSSIKSIPVVLIVMVLFEDVP